MTDRRARRPAGTGSMARHIRSQPAEDPRIAALERELTNAKGWARRLWNGLKARRGQEFEAFDIPVFFGFDGARIVDAAFDAAEVIYDRHHISVTPCSRILDGQVEGRDFIGCWPDGTQRNLTRDQLLMMAGMDPEQ